MRALSCGFLTLFLAASVFAAETITVQADAAKVYAGETITFSIAIKKANNGNPANLNHRRVDATFPNSDRPVTLTSTGNATFTYAAVTQGQGNQTLTVTLRQDLPQAENALVALIAQAHARIAAWQAELATTTNPIRRLVLQVLIQAETAVLQTLQDQLAQLRAPLATGSASIFVARVPQIAIQSPSDGQTVRATVPVSISVVADLPSKAALVIDNQPGAFVAVGVSDFSLNFDTSLLADGQHSLRVSFVADDRPDRVFATPSILLKVDNTAPVFADLQPSGLYGKNNRPTFSASYSDAASGIDIASVKLFVNGTDVTAQASVQADKVTYTPSASLADGLVTWKVSVADKAGNSAEQSASFNLDATQPVIQPITVSPKARTKNPRPTFTATFGDGTGTLDANATQVLLDGADVKAQAVLTDSSLAFTPSSDLVEGVHSLTLRIADLAGNEAVSSAAVTIDLTPPAAPLASSITRGADRVTFFGETEPDVRNIQAEVSGASLESAVIASWSAVVTKTNANSFELTVRLEDEAGNVSAPTVFNESFVSAGPPIQIVGVTPLGYRFLDGDVYYFGTNTASFDAHISGGQAPLSVTFNGVAATNNADQYTANVSLPEGSSDVAVEVLDAAGQSASATVHVSVDTQVPIIKLETPEALTTAGVGFLFLNGLSASDAAAIRNSTSLPRTVYGRDSFALNGQASGTGSDIESFGYEIREIDAFSGDLNFPFHDYASEKAGELASILQNLPVRSGTVAVTANAPETEFPFSFSTSTIAANLPDSDRIENSYYYKYKIYLLTLTATDRLGQSAKSHIWFKVDTKGPQMTGLLDGLYKGTGQGQTDANNVFMGGVLPGPVTGIFADPDVVISRPGTDAQSTPMLRGWPGGPWLLATPQNVVFDNDLTDNGTPGDVQLEDLAGNKRAVHYYAHAGNWFFGTVIDNVRYQWNTSPFFCAESQTHIVNPKADASILGRGTQYNPNAPVFFYIPPVSPQTAGIDALTVDGHPFVALTPSWSSPRQHSYTLAGSFPYADFDKATATYYNGISGMPAGTSDQSYQPPPAANPVMLSNFILDQGVQQKSNTAFSGTTQFDSNTSALVKPGLNVLSLTYTGARFGGIISRTLPTGNTCTNTLNGQVVPESKFESWRTNGFTSMDTMQKPRTFTVMQVTPDALVSGQQQVLKIRGYFGDNLKAGDMVQVSFAPSTGEDAGAGVIRIIPTDPQGNPSGPASSSGNGRIVIEDPFNITVLQTIEVLVEPEKDNPVTIGLNEAAVGLFDLTTCGLTLPKAMKVSNIEFLDSNNLMPISYFPVFSKKPQIVITSPQDGEIVNGSSISIVGYVLAPDPLSPISEIYINDVSYPTSNGSFSIPINVSQGANHFFIRAVNEIGAQSIEPLGVINGVLPKTNRFKTATIVLSQALSDSTRDRISVTLSSILNPTPVTKELVETETDSLSFLSEDNDFLLSFVGNDILNLNSNSSDTLRALISSTSLNLLDSDQLFSLEETGIGSLTFTYSSAALPQSTPNSFSVKSALRNSKNSISALSKSVQRGQRIIKKLDESDALARFVVRVFDPVLKDKESFVAQIQTPHETKNLTFVRASTQPPGLFKSLEILPLPSTLARQTQNNEVLADPGDKCAILLPGGGKLTISILGLKITSPNQGRNGFVIDPADGTKNNLTFTATTGDPVLDSQIIWEGFADNLSGGTVQHLESGQGFRVVRAKIVKDFYTTTDELAFICITVAPKSTWHPDPIRLQAGVDPMVFPIKKLVIHHTSNVFDDTFDDVLDIQRGHLKRKFADIGYHYLIVRNPEIQKYKPIAITEGRNVLLQGSHAEGANVGTIGVNVLGNFEEEGLLYNTFTSEIQSELELCLTWLLLTHKIASARVGISCHAFEGTTETQCPGSQIWLKLSDFQSNETSRLRKLREP